MCILAFYDVLEILYAISNTFMFCFHSVDVEEPVEEASTAEDGKAASVTEDEKDASSSST